MIYAEQYATRGYLSPLDILTAEPAGSCRMDSAGPETGPLHCQHKRHTIPVSMADLADRPAVLDVVTGDAPNSIN